MKENKIEELFKKLNEIVDEGVSIANKIRTENGENLSSISIIQKEMFAFGKEKKLPELVGEIMKEDPSRRKELQLIILALTGEGKRVEDSLLAEK